MFMQLAARAADLCDLRSAVTPDQCTGCRCSSRQSTRRGTCEALGPSRCTASGCVWLHLGLVLGRLCVTQCQSRALLVRGASWCAASASAR